MVVAVHDPGGPRRGAVVVEPGRHPVEVGDLRAGVAVELGVGVELAHPPVDLALEEPVGVAVVGEPAATWSTAPRAAMASTADRPMAWRTAGSDRWGSGSPTVGLKPSTGSIR